MTTIDMIDDTIYYTTHVFTPDEAAGFLSERSFEHNRSIRRGKVNLLATKIKTGRYKDNGMPSVSVAKDGKMRNGHHTLAAVIKSECQVRLRIAWNIPDDTYETFDTGAVRSAADILASSGHTNTQALAALLRPIIRWERGFRTNGLFASDAATHDPILPSDYEDAISVYGDEIRSALNFSQAHKGFVSGSNTGRIKTNARALFNPTALGLVHFVIHDLPGGDEYLHAVVTGADLAMGSPALTVRNFFTAQNPKEIAAVATLLRGYRRDREGMEWSRVDVSKFVDNSKLWDVSAAA